MRPDDLFVHVHSRKFCCVLDPALVLGSRFGLVFAMRLSRVLEPWLTRSFWRMIDSSELILPTLRAAAPSEPACALQPLPGTLQEWIVLRDNTDAGSWPFRWVGDNVAESQFQGVADAALVTRYEALAEALESGAPCDEDSAAHSWPPGWDDTRISLDTVALSAALGGALVLTVSAAGQEPWPVRTLAQIGCPARLLDPLPTECSASLFAAERELLRDALVTAELTSVAQELPRLAALHVSVGPSIAAARPADGFAPMSQEGLQRQPWIEVDGLCDELRGWWYYL
ncbi:hypothetical protein F0160_25865 [Paraburkholderia sp. JPY303]|uniref:hypothetical protein n=1 Tax=Paraburkholderia atlantica TaxID=2654982 RepID=UPI0015911ED3|nr:hypothetical protein [Paraburkholderia atlantica]NUY33905.1 hypothetical protein [Paraburkholderia atlantica]